MSGRYLLLLVAVLLLAACGPAPAAPVPSTPAAQSSGSAAADPEWERIVSAAKQEGRVVIAGAPGESWRAVLSTLPNDYPGIAVDYTGFNSRDFFPRLRQERQAGIHAWDVRVGGTDTLSFDAKNDGMMTPVRPLLRLPDVTKSDVWLQGLDGRFSDKDGSYIFAFVAYANPAVFVNRDFIPEPDLTSIDQLTDPRWRGRIVLQDPRGGSGLLTLSAFLQAYGEGFVRDLLTAQEPVVTSDNRQQAEWLSRGRYPIGVGVDNTQLGDFQAQGVGTNVKAVQRGVKRLTSGFGTIQAIDRPPNPNATTVFVNWLLTPAVQTRLMEATHVNSARLDVTTGNPETAIDRNNLAQYLDINREEYRPLLEQAERLSRELVK